MAGKQSSEVKRRTASTRKTTTTRKSSAGKKRNTSGKSANTKVSRMQVSEYTEPVGDEIKLQFQFSSYSACLALAEESETKRPISFLAFSDLLLMRFLFFFLSAAPFTYPTAAVVLHGLN